MITTSMLKPQSTRNSLGGQLTCFKTVSDRMYEGSRKRNLEDADSYIAGKYKIMNIGPGSYSITGAIGTKLINSTQTNSVAYSFSKETRDEASKVADFVKEVREKSLPRDNPGPAQYRSESLSMRPKAPRVVMTRAKRFPSVGKFFYYKVAG